MINLIGNLVGEYVFCPVEASLEYKTIKLKLLPSKVVSDIEIILDEDSFLDGSTNNESVTLIHLVTEIINTSVLSSMGKIGVKKNISFEICKKLGAYNIFHSSILVYDANSSQNIIKKIETTKPASYDQSNANITPTIIYPENEGLIYFRSVVYTHNLQTR